jgi:hypothetical protein
MAYAICANIAGVAVRASIAHNVVVEALAKTPHPVDTAALLSITVPNQTPPTVAKGKLVSKTPVVDTNMDVDPLSTIDTRICLPIRVYVPEELNVPTTVKPLT